MTFPVQKTHSSCPFCSPEVERLLPPLLKEIPPKVTPSMKRPLHALYLRAVEQAVSRGTDRREPFLSEEGENYICSTCLLPTKPCLKDPTVRCASMRLEGTLLKLVDEAMVEFVHSGERRCVACGAKFKTRQLSNNPLTEVCGACRSRVRRIRRSSNLSGV